MANSYPWSHRQLYVDQSPLFNADKIHTPLLLLHGNADLSAAEEELADVLNYCFLLASKLHLDPIEIVRKKLALNAQKYPVEKSKGRSTKYDQL